MIPTTTPAPTGRRHEHGGGAILMTVSAVTALTLFCFVLGCILANHPIIPTIVIAVILLGIITWKLEAIVRIVTLLLAVCLGIFAGIVGWKRLENWSASFFENPAETDPHKL